MAEKDRFDYVSRIIQTVSVLAGVVITVLSFNAAREKEADAREREAELRRVQASQTFLDLRQKLYLDAVKQAGILSNPEVHSADEIAAAKKRFRQLYVAELSLIEDPSVEATMVNLAKVADPDLGTMTASQKAAYDLAHALRDSLVRSWRVDPVLVQDLH